MSSVFVGRPAGLLHRARLPGEVPQARAGFGHAMDVFVCGHGRTLAQFDRIHAHPEASELRSLGRACCCTNLTLRRHQLVERCWRPAACVYHSWSRAIMQERHRISDTIDSLQDHGNHTRILSHRLPTVTQVRTHLDVEPCPAATCGDSPRKSPSSRKANATLHCARTADPRELRLDETFEPLRIIPRNSREAMHHTPSTNESPAIMWKLIWGHKNHCRRANQYIDNPFPKTQQTYLRRCGIVRGCVVRWRANLTPVLENLP